MQRNRRTNSTILFVICLIVIVAGSVSSQSTPSITNLTPNTGVNTGSVNITDLAGTGFATGATVKLRKVGQNDIVASNVTVLSSSRISCTFNLSDKETGSWDVMVTTPDVQPPPPPIFNANIIRADVIDKTMHVATTQRSANLSLSGSATKTCILTNGFTIEDGVPPTVTIDQAVDQTDPTNAAFVTFTAIFSVPVLDFTNDDVIIAGTAGATTTSISNPGGDHMTYTITVSGMTSDGTVVASIPAGVVNSAANIGNAASTSIDDTVNYDATAPVLAITTPTSEPTCTRNTQKAGLKGTVNGIDIQIIKWSSDKSGGGECTYNRDSGTWAIDCILIDTSGDTITITANDTAGNTSYDSLEITVINSVPGDVWQGLRMVSLPIIPDDEDPKLVVGFAGNSWALYDAFESNYSVYPDAHTHFSPNKNVMGQGFWARFESGSTSSPCGMIPDQSEAKTIKLYSGWNMIGQPFIKPLKWDISKIKVKIGAVEKTLALAAEENLIDDYAWGWNPTDWQYYIVYDPAVVPGATDSMASWEGYWIKAYVDCEIVLPSP